MSALIRHAVILVLVLLSGNGRAGSPCDPQPVDPGAVAAAADTALQVRQLLEQADAPVALLARVGQDLKRYGLRYSHLGFVLRDHADGRWTVLHLLNHCGSERSDLFADGLVNFFADDLLNQDFRLIWLQPEYAERLVRRLQDNELHRLHEPRYSVIARPDSRHYQNSTTWVLDVLASAELNAPIHRVQAQAMAVAIGHRPDIIDIPYSKRVVGALFAANVAFNDHPLSTRLSGRYPVVTVRSIIRALEQSQRMDRQIEARSGQLSALPGPA